ncbi:MAG TPA: hypothetical protein VFI34_10660 [Candidatus Limnocylindrales bacterium]|nr:hypothetical protein [Candidatus Limnocylindrales bacterium]
MRRAVLAAVLLAAVAAPLAAVPARSPLAASPVAAAASGLTLTADARYVVDPPRQRVRVAVTLTATNHKSDTKTHRFYFDRAFLAVQPGTKSFKISSAGVTPAVRVSKATSTYTLLQIDFGKRLGAGQSRAFVLSFVIPDPGGAPTRTTRIGQSLVSFGAWGFGVTGSPGGSVSVVFPPDFSVDVEAAGLHPPTTDAAGNTTYTTGPLANPLSFFAYFVADRPSAYRESTIQVAIGDRTVPIAIRAWPDDAAWAKRVDDILRRGLPILAKEIGLPWTVDQPLVVSEAISRSTAGFSGRYDPPAGQIDIAYYATPVVVLHEAAHAWFDGSLLADRWANEGFASYYAYRAAAALKIKVTPPAITPAQEPLRLPLNAWPAPGAAPTATDDLEYAAAYELASAVATRATPAQLQAVWQAIHEHRAAYQPSGAGVSPETVDAAPDWRGLLDVLEAQTGAPYDDLWRTWVIRPGEDVLLDQRAAARARYEGVVQRADPWLMPRVVRDSLRVWQFDQTNELLDSASSALDDRDAVADAAAGAGLTTPSTMETDFEGPRGFAVTSAEADAELAAINAYRQAAAAKPLQPSLLHEIGLWSSDPSAAMATAAAAFTAGDLRATVESTALARQMWVGADEIGRNRVAAVGFSLAALLLGLWLLGRWYRERRVRRRSFASHASRIR